MIHKALTKTASLYNILQYVFIAAYISLLVIPIPIPFVCYFLLPVVNIFGFLFYKDYLAIGEKKAFMIFRIGMIIFLITVPNYIRKSIAFALGKNIPFLAEIFFDLFMVALGCYIFFYENEKKEAAISGLKVKDTLSKGGSTDDGKDKYDVVLCKNKGNSKPVVIKGHDRFVHQLVIGPTGCGKTSQVLIPMILQDLRKGNGIIVIEPKGDLAEIVYAMGVKFDQPVLYFNPIMPDCPKFNPLAGKESDVIENMTTVFTMLMPDSQTYFKEMANVLIRRSLMLLKRLETAYMDYNTGISRRPATLAALSDLIQNTNGKGNLMVKELISIPTIDDTEREQNLEIRDWFTNRYFSDRSAEFENTSGIRSQVTKLIQNRYLYNVLCPSDGRSDINFDKVLSEGGKIAICTAQGQLRELSSYLGYFIIYTLQSAIFRRPGNENTRLPSFLYIDEFQKYSNPGFSDILTQGRSYRVGAILATQGRQSITMNSGHDGKAFLEVVSANARNQIVFPGISKDDAKYFSDTFGEIETEQVRVGETKQKFNMMYGFRDMNYPTESVQKTEVKEARFSATDITYKPFSEFHYRLIVDNSVGTPDVGVASWIDEGLNGELRAIVNVYNDEQSNKMYLEEKAREEVLRKKVRDWQNERGMYNDTDNGMDTEELTSGGYTVPPVKEPVQPNTANVHINSRFTAGRAVGTPPEPRQPDMAMFEDQNKGTVDSNIYKDTEAYDTGNGFEGFDETEDINITGY